jgi:hypothetical protein
MSQYEQDPSANTGRFRAFVEGSGEEEAPRTRRLPLSPAVLVVAVVVVLAVVILISALA